MASRGTGGPSPQTETFHRPTGGAEHSQEKNIKSGRERQRGRDEKRKKRGERQSEKERKAERERMSSS